MVAAVFLELEGVLLDGENPDDLFFTYAQDRNPFPLSNYLSYYLFPIRWGMRLGRLTHRKNKAYLADLRRSDVEAVARHFVRKDLVYDLRSSIRRRLNQHLQANDQPILLTSAADFLAQPLAEQLGIPHCRASQYPYRGNNFLPRPPLLFPWGENKIRIAEEMCSQLGTRLADSIAYCHQAEDLPLLEKVGQPIVVAPGGKLRRHAEKKGWEIIDH
jgi:phosphoserine phosphatase